MLPSLRVLALTAGLSLGAALSASAGAQQSVQIAPDHDALVALFKDFRKFVPPQLRDGVPDYSAAAMGRQLAGLETFKNRLAAIDDTAWPIGQRVDYMLVLAEMRGPEFQLRVLKPWERDPAFYSTTDLGFGPKMHGAMRIAKLPLAATDLPALKASLDAVPRVFAQARNNLTAGR